MYKAKKVALVFEQKPNQVWFFDLRKVEESENPVEHLVTAEDPPKLEDPDAYDEATATSLDHLQQLSREQRLMMLKSSDLQAYK